MLRSTNAARRAGRMGTALAVATLLGMTACGSVVVQNPGTGGTASTGTGAATSTSTAVTGATTTSSAAVTSSTSTTGVTTTSSAAVTSSSSSGSAACSPACGYMLTCCDGTCAELDNDLLNCGGCGIVCTGGTPYCDDGVCKAAPCTEAQTCPAGDLCCGAQCCAAGEICCDSFGGPAQPEPHCQKPVNGTCSQSCFLCN